jgi:ferritin-like metal-binding protein YciE
LPMTISTARDIFVLELSQMLSAEHIIYRMLGNVARETNLPDAREAYEQHINETETHISNMEAALESIGETPEKATCLAAKGLSDEHDALKRVLLSGHARELGLLYGASKTEHYEIASYTMLIQLASELHEYEAATLLQANLDDELAMAKQVEKLAIMISKDAMKTVAVPA